MPVLGLFRPLGEGKNVLPAEAPCKFCKNRPSAPRCPLSSVLGLLLARSWSENGTKTGSKRGGSKLSRRPKPIKISPDPTRSPPKTPTSASSPLGSPFRVFCHRPRACQMPVLGLFRAPVEGNNVFPAKALCKFCTNRPPAPRCALSSVLGLHLARPWPENGTTTGPRRGGSTLSGVPKPPKSRLTPFTPPQRHPHRLKVPSCPGLGLSCHRP